MVALTEINPANDGGDVFRRLIELGIALSAERDHDRLQEMILLEAKRICNADGGTLYILTEDEQGLEFAIMRNDTLNIAKGGTTGIEIPFPPLSLIRDDGAPNYSNVATAVALTKTTVNIPDAYEETSTFDFSGTMAFDKQTNYRSMSFLTVPLTTRQDSLIGVLQLINARDAQNVVTPFSPDIQPIIEALSSQAAVAIENEMLLRSQRELLDSFIELMAGSIDAKSAYTGGHCQRVPLVTELLAKAACESTEGIYADFSLNEDEWYELHLAGWLHDCGKVATPEYVVDKATKLETIYNRIHEIRTRFEVLRRDAEIEMWKQKAQGTEDDAVLEAAFAARCRELGESFALIAETNIGGEFLDDETATRVNALGDQTWIRHFDRSLGLSWEESNRLPKDGAALGPAEEKLLDDRSDHLTGEYNLGERYNLSIQRGTLTEEERVKINDHIRITISMLEQLPFPKTLKRVPEFAGGHHEKMDGTGYPNGLTRDEMSLPARMMAIADIFEALTASDRPYKKAKKLSECIRIMSFMKKDAHIDPDLFDLFLKAGIWREYADQFLHPEQIDDVDINEYLDQPVETAAQ
jgi:HD-GYP domain-containing protein (c-di-GMP phosphodiesterase class II)